MTPGMVALAVLQATSLFFREDWKETPPQTPVTPDHVAHPDLILTCHGPGRVQIRKSHHDQPADDPYYVWSGEATSNWAVSLRHRGSAVDLTGPARIRWRSRQTGFSTLRIILKLGDGGWVVGDAVDGESAQWRVREFPLSDVHWRALDIETVVDGRPRPRCRPQPRPGSGLHRPDARRSHSGQLTPGLDRSLRPSRAHEMSGSAARSASPCLTPIVCYILNHMVQYGWTGFDASFAALSDATRRGVLEQLGRADASITDLAEKFHMTLTGMKKHVGVLEQAGLVTTEKVGRVRTCRLGPRRLEEEAAWIERYRQLWDARFDELDKVVEELKRKEKVDGRKKKE